MPSGSRIPAPEPRIASQLRRFPDTCAAGAFFSLGRLSVVVQVFVEIKNDVQTVGAHAGTPRKPPGWP